MAEHSSILGLYHLLTLLIVQQWIINCYNVTMNISMNLALSVFPFISLGEIPSKGINVSKSINTFKTSNS